MTVLVTVSDARGELAVLLEDSRERVDVVFVVGIEVEPHLVKDAAGPIDVDLI